MSFFAIACFCEQVGVGASCNIHLGTNCYCYVPPPVFSVFQSDLCNRLQHKIIKKNTFKTEDSIGHDVFRHPTRD